VLPGDEICQIEEGKSYPSIGQLVSCEIF